MAALIMPIFLGRPALVRVVELYQKMAQLPGLHHFYSTSQTFPDNVDFVDRRVVLNATDGDGERHIRRTNGPHQKRN